MAGPFLIGPELREWLYLFNLCLQRGSTRDEEGRVSRQGLVLDDRETLCYSRVTQGRRLGFEFRVPRRAVCRIGAEDLGNGRAALTLFAAEQQVQCMFFMPCAGVVGDHGYSHGVGESFVMGLRAQDLKIARHLLGRIVAAPGSAWFAELPSLWGGR